MKRILQKVASIFVATAMVAALGVSAMAAGMPDTGNRCNNLCILLIPFNNALKGIKLYNPDELKVNAPNYFI